MEFTGCIDRALELAHAEASARSPSATGVAIAVAILSPLGIPKASLELTEGELRSFAAAVRPFGFTLLLMDLEERRAQFALDRRAANSTLGHPLRRRGERPVTPTPIRRRSSYH